MKKRVIPLMLILMMIFSVNSFATTKIGSGTTVTVFPATETTVNGMPESELIAPRMVFPWIFSHYDPSRNSINDRFKEIAQYDHDNTDSSTPFEMSVTVDSSKSQGSEWEGSVSFTTTVKAGMFAGVEAQTGLAYKESRSTNEAVGVGGKFDVPPGKYGHIKFWYKGRTTSGSLVYYRYNDYTGDKEYMTVPVNATFYVKDYPDVSSKAWDDYSRN